MQDRKAKLYQKLHLLDHYSKTLQQFEKDRLYAEILSLRPTNPKDMDAIGYNQLHWAVFCNQSVNEINRLIQRGGVDVNCGTEFVKPIEMHNVTPLHIAVKVGSEELVDCLMKNNATQEYNLKHINPLVGPLSGNDYSTISNNVKSAQNFALKLKNPTFKLFEKSLLEQHRNKLANDPNEYNSILPSRVAACLYYSNKQELKAAEELNKVLNNEPNLDKLKNLKNEYPAVEQNELGEIYNASLKARM